MTSSEPGNSELVVLPYEQRSETTSMVWVLRFLGIWFIVAGVAPLADSAVIALLARAPVPEMVITWRNLWPAASVLLGLALLTRWRMVWIGLPWLLLGRAVADFAAGWSDPEPVQYTVVLGSLWVVAVQWLIIRAIRLRAEGQGALRPVRVAGLAAGPGDNMQFLLECVGWYYLGTGLSCILQVPGLVMGLGKLDVKTFAGAVSVGLFALSIVSGAAGFYLVRRRRWAMIVLIAVPLAQSIFLKACMQFLLIRPMAAKTGTPGPDVAMTLLIGSLSVLAYMAMLRVVDARAAKHGAYGGR